MTPEANSDNDPTIPAMAPRNWPGLGSERADTLQPFYDHTWNFDNQSDDIAQLLTLPSGPVHPILQGPNGPITMFPDHMHEGEVITPWRFDDTLTFNGQSFVEYPVGALNAYDPGGWQEKPIIIAGGDVINGHSTPREEGKPCEGAFRADPAQTIGKRINVLCAYDGRNAETTTYFQSPGVGRVVTDSSFHHYLDLNLIGHPCGVGAKTQGFRTPAGTEVLAGLKAFFVNTVVWLANIPRLALTLDQTSVIGGLQAATGQCGWSPSPPPRRSADQLDERLSQNCGGARSGNNSARFLRCICLFYNHDGKCAKKPHRTHQRRCWGRKGRRQRELDSIKAAGPARRRVQRVVRS